MRPTIIAFALSAVIFGSGCGRGPHPGPPPGGPRTGGSHDIVANSFFGSVRVTAMDNACAGRVQLAQGAATVNDACFTGDTNVVLCTDASSASAVQCTASNGRLTLAGTAGDFINYARVR